MWSLPGERPAIFSSVAVAPGITCTPTTGVVVFACPPPLLCGGRGVCGPSLARGAGDAPFSSTSDSISPTPFSPLPFTPPVPVCFCDPASSAIYRIPLLTKFHHFQVRTRACSAQGFVSLSKLVEKSKKKILYKKSMQIASCCINLPSSQIAIFTLQR